jgi:hypothetical protein
MFLIEQHGMVRAICPLAFLRPAVLLNDIKTRALQESATTAAERLPKERRH